MDVYNGQGWGSLLAWYFVAWRHMALCQQYKACGDGYMNNLYADFIIPVLC